MTNIEQKLLKKVIRNSRLANLATKKMAILEKELQKESERAYYADSWDQSAQISEEIGRLHNNIAFLKMLKQKFICGFGISLSDCAKFKKICIYH